MAKEPDKFMLAGTYPNGHCPRAVHGILMVCCMNGRASIWSHGTWIIQHGEQISVAGNDRRYHNPSFLHLQTKGIPQGFRRRSDEAQKRRKEKAKERDKARDPRGKDHSSGAQSRWGGSTYAGSDRWVGRTQGSDTASQWSWNSRQGDWQSRWSTQEDRDLRRPHDREQQRDQVSSTPIQPYYRPTAKRTSSQTTIGDEKRGFEFYERTARQARESQEGASLSQASQSSQAASSSSRRAPQSSQAASSSSRGPGASTHAAEAATSSRLATPAGDRKVVLDTSVRHASGKKLLC
eukprot:2244585-Amphidinium_carterae.1